MAQTEAKKLLEDYKLKSITVGNKGPVWPRSTTWAEPVQQADETTPDSTTSSFLVAVKFQLYTLEIRVPDGVVAVEYH